MAKRLTDTEKWKDDWYISLSNDYRLIWQWLVDNCSHSGLCKRSISLLNVMCRTSITEDELLRVMDGRVVITKDYWFIPNFIKFQYASLFNNKPAILSVVRDIYKFNLQALIPESFGNDYKMIYESFENHCEMIKDKVKDKDKDKDKKSRNIGNFNQFRKEGKPDSIWVDGREHFPIKNGDGWVYNTLNAISCDLEAKLAHFSDGTSQPLGQKQIALISASKSNLEFIKKGLIQ